MDEGILVLLDCFLNWSVSIFCAKLTTEALEQDLKYVQS